MKRVLRKRKNNNISIRMIPLEILLLTATLKWFIEGILDKALLEVVFLAMGLLILVLCRGLKICKDSLPWLLFIFNVGFSLLFSNSTFGLWGRGIVTILIFSYILFLDYPVLNYQKVMKFLNYLGWGTCLMVLMHYFLADTFNAIYFPMLNSTARSMAELYTRYGYYFGLMYNPHEPAGLIVFSLASLMIGKIVSKSKKIMGYFGALLLLAALLLTGKKAVLICMVIALVITLFIVFLSKKQWSKILRLLFLVVSLSICFVLVARSNPHIELFERFNQFFASITQGVSFDSGRTQLYKVALEEWKENPLFGIGWRHFNALTTTKYGMTQSHEVNCDYLQWLCETGIVGFVLSMIPIIMMIYRTVYVGKKVAKRIINKREAGIVLLALFIQIYTLIYAFVEIPFFDIVYSSVYVVSCVVINSAYRRRMDYL